MLKSVASLGVPLVARSSLVMRAGALLVLLFLEKTFLNQFVDFTAADAAHGMGAALRLAQHYGLRFAVSLIISLALLIYVKRAERLREVNDLARVYPVRWLWLAGNGVAVAALGFLLPSLYGVDQSPLRFAAQASASVMLALGATLSLALAASPLRLWLRGGRAIGPIWWYATSVALLATVAIQLSQSLWAPTAGLTFQLVHWTLQPLLPQLHADPALLVLSTDHFAVQVSEICSGLEGLGLMLIFSAVWLICFRQEYRFPRALLMIPAGLLLIFSLNVVRIAALVLIGNAGYPDIAIMGFHSQAGWIAFNATACGVAFVSLRIPWFTSASRAAEATAKIMMAPPASSSAAAGTSTAQDTSIAAYLLPFLALLAAGMLSRASSAGFEWLYSLRLLLCGAALVLYWNKLRHVGWSCTWRGPVAGALVFVMWLFVSQLFSHPTGMPDALASASVHTRLYWIVTRCVVAIALVPIAEELAYRGFLMRRIVSEHFESVRFASVGLLPLAISSVAFGLGHGAMSGAAIVAGVAYGGLLVRGGRFGEAVAAHAVSNALIAATVIMFGQWQLW